MIKYVVGFLFNEDMTKVILIKKNRPDWQKGLLNGIGGHIEGDEDQYEATKREFEEEAGLIIDNWNNFCEIKGDNYICYFLYSISNKYLDVKQMTDEELYITDVNDLNNLKVIENLRWLIPMCKDRSHIYCVALS